MAATPQRIVMGDRTFAGPRIHVVFEGFGGSQQVATSVDFSEVAEQTFAGVIKHAWRERFMEAIDNLHNRSKYAVSTAMSLAVKTKLQDADDLIELQDIGAPEETLKPLWLFYEVGNSILADSRAKAASDRVQALKLLAKNESPPMLLSDTVLARVMLNKLCSPFVKALGRSNTESTPADGRLVGIIEDKLDTYMVAGGMEQMRKDAEPILAARGVKRPPGGGGGDGEEGGDGAVGGKHPPFGPVAEAFLLAYITTWRTHGCNRPERNAMIATIMAAGAADPSIDASWWTPECVNTKMKKLSTSTKKKAAQGLAGGGGGAGGGTDAGAGTDEGAGDHAAHGGDAAAGGGQAAQGGSPAAGSPEVV